MANFKLVDDLKIGNIVEVAGSSIRVEIGGEVSELTRSYQGRVYPIGQMGSIVKIHFGRRLIFGFVTLLRMRSEEIIETSQTYLSNTPFAPDPDQRMMHVELFAEGVWQGPDQKLKFVRGVSTYPLPRQGVFLLTRDELVTLYKSAESQKQDEFGAYNPLVPFATYTSASAAQCRANIDKMFSMHCAVLGSTGSGKSAAVAALLHSVSAHKPFNNTACQPRIIIIDPHGEYSQAFKDKAITYRAYDAIGHDQAAEAIPIQLPYWLMTAEEFRLLTIGKGEFEATSQNNIIYKALNYARLVAAGLVNPAPTSYGGDASQYGNPLDEPRPNANSNTEQIRAFNRDKPMPFCLDELVNHITFLQAARVTDNRIQSISNTDFARSFKSILDKISVLRHDYRLRFLMQNWVSGSDITLETILKQLISNNTPQTQTKTIRILDTSGLPNEVAGPLTSMVARLLFQYKLHQTPEERKNDPILLVCEEAHRYIPQRGTAEYAAAQSAIKRIAREGRKYGLGLMLVSQRPADVASTVISQCGTWLVLRLSNQADQEHVARFLPDGLAGMTKALSSLAQQEAIFVGEAAALPARIIIRHLEKDQLPASQSAQFAKGWVSEGVSVKTFKEIAARMSHQAQTLEGN